MSATYTPQPDSVAARVIVWFQANPTESLDVDALEAKFDKPRKQWHSLLGSAVIAGVLKRQTNDDEEIEYSLGTAAVGVRGDSLKEHQAAHQATHPTTPTTTTRSKTNSPAADALLQGGWLGAKPGRKRINKPPFICDPLSFTIQNDRPIPPGLGKGRFGTDWRPLLKKLKVGQSVEVPKASQPSLSKQMLDSKKAGTGEFVLRKINDETFGLWRVK